MRPRLHPALLAFLLAAVPGQSVKVLWMGDHEQSALRGQAHNGAPTHRLSAGSESSTLGSANSSPSSPSRTDQLLQEALSKMEQLSEVASNLTTHICGEEGESVSPIKLELVQDLRLRGVRVDAVAAYREERANRLVDAVETADEVDAGVVAKSMMDPTGKIRFTFTVHHDKTKPGDKVMVVGGHPQLGDWTVTNALTLTTSGAEFPMWSSEVYLEPGLEIPFKFVVQTNEGVVDWEVFEQSEQNRNCSVPVWDGDPAAPLLGGLKAKFNKPGEVVLSPADVERIAAKREASRELTAQAVEATKAKTLALATGGASVAAATGGVAPAMSQTMTTSGAAATGPTAAPITPASSATGPTAAPITPTWAQNAPKVEQATSGLDAAMKQAAAFTGRAMPVAPARIASAAATSGPVIPSGPVAQSCPGKTCPGEATRALSFSHSCQEQDSILIMLSMSWTESRTNLEYSHQVV